MTLSSPECSEQAGGKAIWGTGLSPRPGRGQAWLEWRQQRREWQEMREEGSGQVSAGALFWSGARGGEATELTFWEDLSKETFPVKRIPLAATEHRRPGGGGHQEPESSHWLGVWRRRSGQWVMVTSCYCFSETYSFCIRWTWWELMCMETLLRL